MPLRSLNTQRPDVKGMPSQPERGNAGGQVPTAFLRAGILLFLLAAAMQADAQANLVPNPSFEDTADCNNVDYSQIETALPWFTPTLGTPDIDFTDSAVACSGTPMFISYPPSLDQGFQNAFHGQRFAAFALDVYPSSHKEYVGIRLTSPLVADIEYLVRFRTSRAEGCDYAVDRIGAYFGPDSLHESHAMHLNVVPQIDFQAAGHFIESDLWLLLQDTFVATGGEEWMYVGNFQDSSEVDLLFIPGGTGWNSAYYYFDSMCVSQVSDVGVAEFDLTPHVSEGGLYVIGRDACEIVHLLVMDPVGRVIQSMSGEPCFAARGNGLSGELAAGIYVVRGRMRSGSHWSAKCLWKGRGP